jgi:hypothetical protein
MACFIFLFIGTNCHSQKDFTIYSPIGTQALQINGEKYTIDSIGIIIRTNYPRFDTLVFLTDASNIGIPIVCNFKPDSVYSLSVACCGSFDIIQTSKLKNDSLKFWDYEKDFDRIQHLLMDKPFVSIRTKHTTQDSIYAWHADAACETQHKIINYKLWRLGVPPKCFYWNNITTIQFFITDKKMQSHDMTNLEEFLGIKNIIELNSISFRLFSNERFIVVFDKKNNNVTLDYE